MKGAVGSPEYTRWNERQYPFSIKVSNNLGVPFAASDSVYKKSILLRSVHSTVAVLLRLVQILVLKGGVQDGWHTEHQSGSAQCFAAYSESDLSHRSSISDRNSGFL